MIRDYKEFGEGEAYHIYNRGNDKMQLFRDEQDYSQFLKRLRLACTRAPLVRSVSSPDVPGRPLYEQARVRWTPGSIRITGFDPGTFSLACYCLMPNHFHLLIRQETEIPISKLILKVLTSYSMYFNRKYDHVGHVFQDRFKAVHITDDTQLLHVSAYIHQNPKVGKLVHNLRNWKYSSYPEYLGRSGDELCDKNILLEQFRSAREYERFVEDSFEDIRARKEVRELMIDE